MVIACFRLAAVGFRDRGMTVAGTLRIGDGDVPLELPVEVVTTADGDVFLRAGASISRAAAGVARNWLGMVRDDTPPHAQRPLMPGHGRRLRRRTGQAADRGPVWATPVS